MGMRLKTLLILPLLVASLQAASVDDLTFALNGDGTGYTLSRCGNSARDSLDIPSTYNGLPVTAMGNGVFSNPPCTSLTSIKIPNSVTSMGHSLFEGCSALTSVVLPDNITSIRWETFKGCDNLTDIVIPDSVTTIEYNAFQSCTSLSSINIPNSVTSIGNFAFSFCRSLTSIKVPDGVTSWGQSLFQGCTNLSNVTISEGVATIGNTAFNGCNSLNSITIPESVTTIEYNAFFSCDSLSSIIFEGDAPTFGTDVFRDSNLVTVYYDTSKSGWSNTVAGGIPAYPYINGSASGLIAYYPFDGNANDESGNEINGQTADHVIFSSDRFGNPNSALKIQGERSNIDGYGVTGSGIHLRDSSVSISFWYQKQVDDYHDWVIGVGDDGNCWIVNIDYSAPDGIAWGVWNDDNVRHNLDPPLALEQWCHVVVTYDKNDTKKCIYVDGELVSEGYTDSSFTGTSNFKFGASGITLDDLRFYNRALSANEVSAIYDSDTGLIAYYPLLSGVSDMSGNELHGNGVGVTFDDGYLNVGSGQYSSGDSYFSIPESVDQFRQNDFTISLWFRLSVTNHSNADGSMLFDIFGDRAESAIGNYISVRMHNDDEFNPINGMESLNGGLVIELREGGSSFNSSYVALGSIVGGLNNGHWHNLSITRRQNTISTYLNGLETSRITSEQIADINNTKPLKLGRSYSGWSSNPNINYKHLKIYDRELSSAEINEAYYEALYNTKNYELVDLRSQGQADVTTTPNDFDLHTPTELTAARSDSRTLGQTDVTGNPAQYSLFTSSDLSDAQTSSRSEGQQDVIVSPSDYDLMGAEGVFDMRVSQPGISMNADKASMNFTIQSSNDLQEWNNEETIQREYTMASDKNFMRVSVGPQLEPEPEPEPEPLPAIATDTYGDKLVYDESNNLYVNDEDTPLMINGLNLKTDTYAGWNFYAIESTGSRYICILKSSTQFHAFTFDSDGNYISDSSVVNLSYYESLLGQSLN